MDREFLDRLCDGFHRAWGGGGERLFCAAGRVNLIGEHVDYHGGTVLPVAIDRGVAVAARRRDDSSLRLASLDFAERLECSLERPPSAQDCGWAAYPVGILRELHAELPVGGMDLCFASTLPIGAGLSSSAAILLATARAASALFDVPWDPLDAARRAHRAEVGFVGVHCGIMDPFASALARPGHALQLSCRDESFSFVPLPARLGLCLFDSKESHDLAASPYNQRVRESREAFRKIRARLPDAACLAQVPEYDLVQCTDLLEPAELRRARHVVTEAGRVARARQALERGDLFSFGEQLHLSHRSLRDLYEVSTPRLDALVAAAEEHPAVLGARLTGAGFGGGVLAAVLHGSEDRVSQHVAQRFMVQYRERPPCWTLGFGHPPGELRT